MKNNVLILLFSLLATVASATKSEQLRRYLGDVRFNTAAPKGEVKFIFDKAVLRRSADGRKTYGALLQDGRFYSDEDNAGRLLGVQIITEAGSKILLQPESPSAARPVQDAPKTQAPAPTGVERVVNPSEINIRPNQMGAATAQPSSAFTLDSLELARRIEAAKRESNGAYGAITRAFRMVWEYIGFWFNLLIFFLLCLLGLARYIAATAANESAVNIHGVPVIGRWVHSIQQGAAGVTLLITWAIALVILVDVFLWLLAQAFPLWPLAILWFVILNLAGKLTDWLVPNPRITAPAKKAPGNY